MGGTPPGAVRDDGAMTSTPTAAAYDPNAPRVVPHPTPSERQARGKAARAQAPREAHADLCLPAERPDPVALLEGQATTRVPELIPIRYGRMLVSPFTFYRGGALIMAGDLAGTPDSGLTVQACGDAHLSNFGVFGTPERHLIFDVNDFDETLPGPWEWDVKRLAASLEIAGRDRGFTGKERKEVVLAAVEQYRQAMHSFAAMGNLDLWYLRFDVDAFLERFRRNLDKAALKRVEKNIAKARGRDRYKTVAKLTHEVDGELRFLSDPPLIVPIDELFEQAADREMLKASFSELLRAYRATLQPDRRALLEQYEFMDLARKVVGVGSVGTRAWIVVLRGRDAGDPLVLQVKEAQRSVLEGFAAPSVYENQGQRVERPDARLAARHRRRRRRTRLLRASAQGLEGLGGARDDAPRGDGRVRPHVRLDAGPRPRALRRPDRDRRLPGQVRDLRPRDRRVRPRLRRPQRGRLRAAARGGGHRADRGRGRGLTRRGAVPVRRGQARKLSSGPSRVSNGL
jgi:uncharacterized protein (DUF2252 family)